MSEKTAYLCGTQLFCPHVRDPEVVGGLADCAESYCVVHLEEKEGQMQSGGWTQLSGRGCT